MSLNIKQLQNVVHLPDGRIRARCPACAADGHDKRGNHLIIFPGGKFGCAVHPGDTAHRHTIHHFAGVGALRNGQGLIRVTVIPKPGWISPTKPSQP